MVARQTTLLTLTGWLQLQVQLQQPETRKSMLIDEPNGPLCAWDGFHRVHHLQSKSLRHVDPFNVIHSSELTSLL